MVDTITLQIERVEIPKEYLSRFQRNGSIINGVQVGRYFFNPDVKREGYLPRITIKKLRGQTEWYTESIDLEFSAPKILCGTNYYGITANDYDELLNSLMEKLERIFIGSPLSEEQVRQSNLKSAAFAFNFILPDTYGAPLEFLKIIPFLDIGKRYTKARHTYYTEETELGYCGRMYNKQIGFKIYDKRAEVINNAKTEEEIEMAWKIKQNKVPSKIMRMEITYQHRTSLKSHLAAKTDKNTKRERHMHELFNNDLCQSILSEGFDKLASEVNVQALDMPLSHIRDSFKIAKEAGMQPYDVYAWIGRCIATQQAGSLQLKLISDDFYAKQTRACLDKRFKKLLASHPLPSFTIKEIFEECRKQLRDFKVNRPPQSYPLD